MFKNKNKYFFNFYYITYLFDNINNNRITYNFKFLLPNSINNK